MAVVTGCIRTPYAKETALDLTYRNPFEPDKEFRAYFMAGDQMLLPRGYPIDLQDAEVKVVASPATMVTKPGYALRAYQVPAVTGAYNYLSPLAYGQCLISAGTGSGKSYSLAELLSMFNLRTLVLSHLTMLGTQIEQELTQNLDCTIQQLSAKSLGKPLADINISSFQLLDSNMELLKYLSDSIGIVVVDEMENAITSSRLKVLFRLRPKYFIYLTATPTRELMQQTSAVEYLYGGKVFYMEPPQDQKVHSQHIMLDYRHMHWDSPANQNMYKSSLHAMYKRAGILRDITRLCLKLSEGHGTIWIVVDRVKLQAELTSQLEFAGLTVATINGGTVVKQRQAIMDSIADGKLQILLGSAPLAAGVSIPRLAYGIRLMPNSSSEELLRQQSGRLGRMADFKKHQVPIWFDFAISGSLEYGAKKRLGIYKASTLGVQIQKIEEVLNEGLLH
jgi:superfamily II DNA or RNA helicase